MRREVLSPLFVLLSFCCAFCLVGCSQAQKTAPHIGFAALELRAELSRSDIVILNEVEGTSTLTSILFGLIQVIDGTKVKFLGIALGFTDKYTFHSVASTPSPDWAGGLPFLGPGPADRAYYKALEKAPDADAVFYKSMDNEVFTFPILFSTKSVTWRGKAIKIKPDK